MLKRIELVFMVIFLFLVINLYGCENNSNDPANSNPVSGIVNDIPIILYTSDSDKEIRDVISAVKIKYNITTKKLETEPQEIFSFKNGYYEQYQWNQENELLFSSGSRIVSVSNNFVLKRDIPISLTKIYKIDNTTYKISEDEQGIVLQESSNDKDESTKINLIKENKEYRNFSPMVLFKYGKDIMILVHYYHPRQDNGMISGLFLVKVSGKNINIDKIDLRGQCCIGDEIEPAVINDNIYINTLVNLGIISIPKKSLYKASFFDTLINEARSDPDFLQEIPSSFHYQPGIGKIGDLLLLSYSDCYTTYIWGVRDDKVVFKIKTAKNGIYDDAGNKIGTTNWEIGKVVLPNW